MLDLQVFLKNLGIGSSPAYWGGPARLRYGCSTSARQGVPERGRGDRSYRRRPSQAVYGVSVVAELSEYIGGVLSDRGDRGHNRLRSVHGRRRQERAQGTDRGMHLPPSVAGFELGVFEKVFDGPHPGVGYLRSVEAFQGYFGREVHEDGLDLGTQVVHIFDALRVAGEAF